MKKRIWELDALRGLCILGMVVVHLLFDLVALFGVLSLPGNGLFAFLTHWGGVLFLLISGICVTLGSHPVRRGLIVFGCGMLCTLATWAGVQVGLFSEEILIRFGVLHCLGLCMLLWPLLKKLPVWGDFALGILLSILGLFIQNHVRVGTDILAPLGLCSEAFTSSDYFPLLPNLGYFLIGAGLGRTVYRNKASLLPRVPQDFFLIRGLIWVGKWSLPIYMLHQPVIAGILYLIFYRF